MRHFIRFAAQLTTALLAIGAYNLPAYSQPAARCPAALDRMRNHTVTSGETLDSVAATYRVAPSTLVRFNPGVGNSLAPGLALSIPPFNGVVVNAGGGDTWQTLAEQYDSRADVLFEVNGCVADVPSQIFVPSLMPTAVGGSAIATQPSTVPQLGYPLAQTVAIARGYGWQPHSTRDELVFNSGIAFAIPSANQVVAVKEGTVAFAGAREGFGQLVVINHAQGLQTRYANLSDVSVSAGQAVSAATAVGSVGSSAMPTFMYFEVRTNSPSGWMAQDPGRYLPDLELR